MKITFLLLFLLCGYFSSQGQEAEGIKTNLDKNGTLTGESIIVFKDKSAAQIYNSSIDWVSYTFNNTESVIQAKIENKMIRINGISKSALGPIMGFYFDLSYKIQLDIKDGKLRFIATDLKQVAQSSPFTSTSLEIIYKKGGELKSGKKYQETKDKIDSQLTELLSSLELAVKGQTKTNNENW
ncbi:MAG: DUF4468 domain-containing protein [Bacteroidota bacterium]|nr:hypothetical protein [Odoribacter sp.]MDP3641907.1 DUF4468 domain-containing protein [Bacteroidota bacterium]